MNIFCLLGFHSYKTVDVWTDRLVFVDKRTKETTNYLVLEFKECTNCGKRKVVKLGPSKDKFHGHAYRIIKLWTSHTTEKPEL